MSGHFWLLLVPLWLFYAACFQALPCRPASLLVYGASTRGTLGWCVLFLSSILAFSLGRLFEWCMFCLQQRSKWFFSTFCCSIDTIKNCCCHCGKFLSFETTQWN